MRSAGGRALGLRGTLGRLASRWRGRPDSEHEMAVNRLVIGPLVLIYLVFAAAFDVPGIEPAFFAVISLYIAASILLAIHLAISPGISVTRRVLAMTLDLGTLSYGLHVGGGITALLYPIYLWTIFGNGFRFGLRYLLIAVAISVVGFSIVVLETEYWRSNPSLAVGLLLGLIILPAYASTLIRKLSDAKRVAEDASRAKSLFLASVSHELRTPLNAVIGMSDLLRDTRLDAEQADMASTIHTSARALLTLIEEILDYSRIDAGRMPMETVDFDLHRALIEVERMVKAQAQAKGIELGLHVTPRTPYRLRGDRKHLQEILINLAGNAVKFTDSGRVLIVADIAEAGAATNRLRVEVIDTGIGISPDATERIFDSFVQADETIINRYGGTGLGLAISKKLAELLGGAIGVESEPGRGSTFWLELPFQAAAPLEEKPAAPGVVMLTQDADLVRAVEEGASSIGAELEVADSLSGAERYLKSAADGQRRVVLLVDETMADCDGAARQLVTRFGTTVSPSLIRAGDLAEALPDARRCLYSAAVSRKAHPVELEAVANMARGAQADATAAPPATRMRSCTVLVAEDNSVNQKVVTKILERAGHKVKIAENGEKAIDMMLAGGVDIVLMDVNMPVMNGIEATKLYRFAAMGRERLPIVALTADATPDAAEQCLAAGMDAVLSKPIETAELFAALDRLATGSAAPQAGADPVAAETVTAIAAHPKFRDETRGAIDATTIADLEALGGHDFIVELAEKFVEEGNRIMAEIREAAANDDAQLFRDSLHALRSGAANIGARTLYETCLAMRSLSAEEFRADGEGRACEVEAEFRRAERDLSVYRQNSGQEPPDSRSRITQFPRKKESG